MIPALGRQRQMISVSLRPAFSTELVPGEDPKLQRNKTEKKKIRNSQPSAGGGRSIESEASMNGRDLLSKKKKKKG